MDIVPFLAWLDPANAEERELPSYVEYLEEESLIESDRDKPVVEKLFSLTGRGCRVAEKLRESVSDRDWDEIERLRKRFERVPLTRLIQYVYQKYPETTSKSVLEHLKPK